MSMTAATATFLAVLPAELPDKTIIACLILSSRYQPSVVFSGAATAFAAQVILGVSVGGALSLLPHHVVVAFAAAAFAVGAGLLWWHRDAHAQADAEEAITGHGVLGDGFWPVFATTFLVVFIAEFGDLTQFMTISLAARFHDPVAVGIGATLGLWVATAAAVTVGWRLLKLIPMHLVTRGSAVVMLVLAVTSALASLPLSAAGVGAGSGRSRGAGCPPGRIGFVDAGYPQAPHAL